MCYKNGAICRGKRFIKHKRKFKTCVFYFDSRNLIIKTDALSNKKFGFKILVYFNQRIKQKGRKIVIVFGFTFIRIDSIVVAEGYVDS